MFPLLHGPWGEDGTIQGLFEIAGIRYVGSGVLASAVGMDKHYMKVVLAGAGLPVMPYVVIKPREWERDPAAVRESVESLGYPVFVKPARGGSSLGITQGASARTGSMPRSSTPASSTRRCIVEASAEDAREIECGVLERLDGGADASVVAEITGYGEHEFYDFAAKYLGEEGVTLEVPADLRRTIVTRRSSDCRWRRSRRLDCEGLARVDFFLAPGRADSTINEINTMPGFTPASMYPRMWAESGVSLPRAGRPADRARAGQRPTGLR